MPKDVSAETKVAALAGHPVEIGNSNFVANAQFARDGMDLTLTAPDGHSVRVEGYFAQTTPPDITTPDGAHFSPQMISAFLPPQHPNEFAAAGNALANDATPAGKITEVVGHATIIHSGGGQEAVKLGALVHQGDIIQTDAKGAVNILFADNTTFAISENARLSVDQFAYNAGEHKGSSFFSMLQGVFVYTSGLIGKEDPGSVGINTPVGSIGIRGTVVAGEIHGAGHDSHITILDGAIVVTNGGGTLEMHSSFDTATLSGYNTAPSDNGAMDATSFATNYSALKGVAPATFNSIIDGTFHAAPADHAPAHNAPVQMPDAGTLDHATGLANAAPAVNFGSTAEGFEGSTQVASTTVALPASTTATGGDHTLLASAPNTGTTTTGAPPASGTGTGGGGGGGNVSTPHIDFAFSSDYTHSTVTTADDGVNVTWSQGETIGTINLTNFTATPNISISGFAGNGDFHGTSLVYDTVSTPMFDTVAAGSQSLLHYDSATGVISLVNPFGASSLNSDFVFTITATDPITGSVLATENVTIHINDIYPSGTPDVSIGDYNGQTDIYSTQTSNDTLNSTNTLGNNEALFGRDGNDTLIAEPGRQDVLFGGNGDDILVVPDMSFYYVDGGANATATGDTLQVGSTLTATQTFNFETDDNVKNIEQISIVHSSTTNVGQTITLTLQDVFEMTDSNHTLQISNSTTGYGSTVVIDNAFSSQDFGTGVVDTSVPGDQTTTYTGTYNGTAVTLVVHQGNAAANDGITTHVTA
ncbi:MAG: FecR domain-containing protein [Micavibrio sp.]|nr:FecR domain-containing protein [Micavibrio sp.]